MGLSIHIHIQSHINKKFTNITLTCILDALHEILLQQQGKLRKK